MDRTERQKECLKRWLKSGGKASIEACTGFGIQLKKLYKFWKNQIFFVFLYQIKKN